MSPQLELLSYKNLIANENIGKTEELLFIFSGCENEADSIEIPVVVPLKKNKTESAIY